jgi:small subunit ribosomal protein S27Ae
MQIFVRSLDKTFAVELNANATLNDLQVAIEDVEFIPKHLQVIVKDSSALAKGALCLSEADTVTLCMGMEGGMRAKWKKKRTRRLRRKRRKMRDRAR